MPTHFRSASRAFRKSGNEPGPAIERDETLAQTPERAGISPQYRSEVERGRKEPPSGMIAALAGALDLTVAELMAGTAEDLGHTRRYLPHMSHNHENNPWKRSANRT
jgi:transcriptional regulator with XRE-family HTH domain